MNKLSSYFLAILSLLSCSEKDVEDHSLTDDISYLIAYNVYKPDSLNDDNYEIFTMELDGSNKTNITKNPDVAWTYHASGSRIFFISDRDTTQRCIMLYEMDIHGNNVKRITDFRLQDSWMGSRKDGEEILIVPYYKLDSAFYLINRNGEILQKFSPGTPWSGNPAFSPDGKRIAFTGKNKRSKMESGYREEIYVVNDDGSNMLQLTQYPVTDTTAEWFAYKAGPPKWHPTENFISYQSKQNGKYSLYAVSPDGNTHWKLTDNMQEEGWHDWSPDGKWLAIELFDKDQTQFHIGIMNWETKEMKILTDTTYKYQQAPVFVLKERMKKPWNS